MSVTGFDPWFVLAHMIQHLSKLLRKPPRPSKTARHQMLKEPHKTFPVTVWAVRLLEVVPRNAHFPLLEPLSHVSTKRNRIAPLDVRDRRMVVAADRVALKVIPVHHRSKQCTVLAAPHPVMKRLQPRAGPSRGVRVFRPTDPVKGVT